jgi:hypothetical protein
MDYGFPRLYEDGTITVCKAIKGIKRPGKGGRELGKKKKSFELTGRKKKLIRCSAIRQFLAKDRKILFCTLTFSKKLPKSYENEKWSNECFSKFMENLKENYGLRSYVVVREDQNKHGEYHLHFHCLLEIPFADFKVLNRAWCHTWGGRMPFSRNAFTTGRQKFAENITQVAYYITKYIGKSEKSYNEGNHPDTRVYFISENVLSKPQIINENTLIYLVTKYQPTVYSNEHYSVYLIRDFFCLPERFAPYKRPPKPKKPKPIPDAMQPNFCF